MTQKTDFLNTKELAKRWGLSVGTLHAWRCKGRGPAFLKLDGSVLYSREAIATFEAGHTYQSTKGRSN